MTKEPDDEQSLHAGGIPDQTGKACTHKSRSAQNPFDIQEQLFPYVVGSPEASAAFVRSLLMLPAAQASPVVAGMASISAIARLADKTASGGVSSRRQRRRRIALWMEQATEDFPGSDSPDSDIRPEGSTLAANEGVDSGEHDLQSETRDDTGWLGTFSSPKKHVADGEYDPAGVGQAFEA